MSEEPTDPAKDINASLVLPCEDHAKPGHRPHYKLANYGEAELIITKVCHEHGQIVTATIEINPFRRIEISGFELRVESVESN